MVLKFLLPLQELFSYIPEMNKYIEEVHPRKVTQEYLASVSGKISHINISKDIEEGLFKPNWDMLDRSKSNIRPLIFLLAIGGLNKEPKDFVKYAALVEMIHNGTLIHDDIEDNAEIRRGDKPIHLKYGVDVAVNSANILYFSPFLLLKKYCAEMKKEKQIRVYNLLIEHLNRVTWGQAVDIYWHNNYKIPSVEEYLQMCAYKTGAIDGLVFSLAASLADIPDKKYEELKLFGEKFGTVLQIHDDFSDVCSLEREAIGGKIVGNDIREGKKSIINLIALNKLKSEKRRMLLEILKEHTKDMNKISKAIDLIIKSGALEITLSLIKGQIADLKNDSKKVFNGKYSSLMIDFLKGMEDDIECKSKETHGL